MLFASTLNQRTINAQQKVTKSYFNISTIYRRPNTKWMKFIFEKDSVFFSFWFRSTLNDVRKKESFLHFFSETHESNGNQSDSQNIKYGFNEQNLHDRNALSAFHIPDGPLNIILNRNDRTKKMKTIYWTKSHPSKIWQSLTIHLTGSTFLCSNGSSFFFFFHKMY